MADKICSGRVTNGKQVRRITGRITVIVLRSAIPQYLPQDSGSLRYARNDDVEAACPKPLRCPTGKTPKIPVNPRRQKYSTLPKFGNGVCIASLRPKEEGRIAIVTNAGRAAVDVSHIGANGFAGRATVSEAAAHTTGVIGVRQNRVVLVPGVCAPSLAVMWRPDRARASISRKATGAIVHRSPGRARHKP
jgi:hypothetical protein